MVFKTNTSPRYCSMLLLNESLSKFVFISSDNNITLWSFRNECYRILLLIIVVGLSMNLLISKTIMINLFIYLFQVSIPQNLCL